jgi:hypothetical protein
LGVLPFHEGGRQIGVESGAEEFEKRGGAVEYLRINL